MLEAALPPGPRSRLWTTYKVATHPVTAMRDYRERYGDPYMLTAVNGPVVCTADPEHIRTLFTTTDPEQFDVFAAAPAEALLGRNSLLLISGARHRRERKLLAPPFHGERMRAYGRVMVEATRRAMSTLSPGENFVAIARTQKISIEAIVRAVFGVEDRGRIEAHERALVSTLEAVKPIFMFAKATQVAPFGLGPWATYRARSAEADRLLYAHIEERRRSLAAETGPDAAPTSTQGDILTLMLEARYEDGAGMSDQAVRDELRTLLIAGHETTAISLAWALDGIHRNPEVKTKLLAELDAHPVEPGSDPDPASLAKLPYLSAVVDETLRLYPVVETVIRKLRKPMRFAGYDLPVGMGIAALISVVHHRADLYPEPARFDPERFLGRKPSPFAYLPFGGGARRCIGAAFSLYETKLAIATIMREYELELREPKPVEVVRRSVTLGPKTGIRMRLLGPRKPRA